MENEIQTENQQTQTKSKQEKYALLRFDPEDELLALAKSVSKKLGMSLSALCKLSLYTYCKPLQGEKKDGITNTAG